MTQQRLLSVHSTLHLQPLLSAANKLDREVKANGGGGGEGTGSFLLPTSLLIDQDTQSDCAEIHLGGLTTKLQQKGDIRTVMERRGIEGEGGRREFREEMENTGREEEPHRPRSIYGA